MSEPTFAQTAKTALVLAYSAARRLCHSCIGSEHILSGLVFEGSGKAWRALFEEGLRAEKLNALLEDHSAKDGFSSADIYLGDDALNIISIASTKAKDGVIGDEHLLLAMLDLPDCEGVRLLIECGVDTSKVCARLLSYDGKEKAAEKELKLTLSHGVDMTQKARLGEYDAVLGREDEIARTLNILSRRQKSNPLFLGEPGVGKTAIAEAVACAIISGNVPRALKGARLISLDVPSVVSGTKYRGEFEDKLRKIILEVKRVGNVILFIDEMHTLCGAGAAEGAIDGANILKPSLARGEIKLMGATTRAEYKKYICRDGALCRRFQTVDIKEPDIAQTERILQGLKGGYEHFHGVSAPDEMVKKTVELTERYIPERCLPDKAIDLFDEALACAASKGEGELSKETLLDCVACMSGISPANLRQEEKDTLSALPERLKAAVIGQDRAVDSLCAAFGASRIMGARGKPRGVFLFCGPTGVGKTLLAKEFAKAISPRRDHLLRFDMSEYMEKHSVSRLIGSPPGYAGYGEGGLLTEGARKYRDGVLLFDEIEKAHPDVLNVLLQLLDEGRVTDSSGTVADFRSNIIIMTSNIGAEKESCNPVGFGEREKSKDEVLKAIKRALRPELLGRIDEIIVFDALKREHFEKIAEKEIKILQGLLEKENITLLCDERLLEQIAEICEKEHKNARDAHSLIAKSAKTALISVYHDPAFDGNVFLSLHGSSLQKINTY